LSFLVPFYHASALIKHNFHYFWEIFAPSLSGAGMKYIFKIKTEGCCQRQSLAPEEWNNS
jgi:hypothetical protein